MSVSYIIHKGKQILYIDYSNCKCIADTIDVLEEVKNEFYITSGIWLTLNDFRIGYGSVEFLKKAIKYAQEIFNTRPSKNAAIGVVGYKNGLLLGYNFVINEKVVAFDTMEEALDYLAE